MGFVGQPRAEFEPTSKSPRICFSAEKPMKAKFTLTPAQEELLRSQVIDAEHPGPILRDFQTVLDFLGTEGVPASGKHQLLAQSAIVELDGRLSRPLHLTLKRIPLHSHPYLQGLHLLLRATGLTRVEGGGSKAQLLPEPTVLAVWNGLNPTERYFALLEAWLLLSRPEMVGERGGALADDPLLGCMQAWQQIPAKGCKFDLRQPATVYVPGMFYGFYHVALMGLFGLMEVEHPRQPVKPWRPAGLKHLPFGDAMFTLLSRKLPSWFTQREIKVLDEQETEEEATEARRFGHWQSLFQPYFPAWQHNLVVPETQPQEGVFVFRVSLGKIWRLIAIPSQHTLDDLAYAILASVDFDDDHLYEFTYRDRFGARVQVLYPFIEEAGPKTDEVAVGEVPLQPGQSMTFLFDFGDNWQFDVQLERIDPPKSRMKGPKILESHGKAPEQYPSWD